MTEMQSPKCNVHSLGFAAPMNTSATQNYSKPPLAGAKQSVVYWAGMRVEGPLRPFRKRVLPDKQYIEQAHNGGIFFHLLTRKV
jgi:hypothetical protein